MYFGIYLIFLLVEFCGLGLIPGEKQEGFLYWQQTLLSYYQVIIKFPK